MLAQSNLIPEPGIWVRIDDQVFAGAGHGKPHDAMMSQVYPLSVVSSMVSSTVRAADNYSNNINTNTPAICKSANVGSIPARTSSLTK
jgi:hypothetical protein